MEQTMKKPIKRFIGSTKMGYLIFKQFFKQAEEDDLRVLFKDINSTLKHHEQMIIDATHDDEINQVNLLPSQSLAVKIEKFKSDAVEDDFSLCILALKTINMGTIGVLSFLHDQTNIPQNLLKVMNEILADYDNLGLKIKDYANRYHRVEQSQL